MEVVLLLIVLGVVCGFICNAIAKSRESMNPGGAFALGFFLGIIGILIVAIMPNRKAAEATAAQVTAAAATAQAAALQIEATASRMHATDTMECPRCAETIKAKAKVCRFCGYELAPMPPRETSTTST